MIGCLEIDFEFDCPYLSVTDGWAYVCKYPRFSINGCYAKYVMKNKKMHFVPLDDWDKKEEKKPSSKKHSHGDDDVWDLNDDPWAKKIDIDRDIDNY